MGGLYVPGVTSQSPSRREAGTHDPGPRPKPLASTAHPTPPSPSDVNISNPNKALPRRSSPPPPPGRGPQPPEGPSGDHHHHPHHHPRRQPHRSEVSLSAWPLGRARGGGAGQGDCLGRWGGVSRGSVCSSSSRSVQIRKPQGEEEGGGGESATSAPAGDEEGPRRPEEAPEASGAPSPPGGCALGKFPTGCPEQDRARARPSPPDQLRGADCELEQNSFLLCVPPLGPRPPAPPSRPPAFKPVPRSPRPLANVSWRKRGGGIPSTTKLRSKKKKKKGKERNSSS